MKCALCKQGVSKKEIMDQYNLGKSTLYNLLKNEKQFQKFESDKDELRIPSAAKVTKRICTGSFDELDNALYIWFRQQRERGCPISGPALLVKAAEFHSLIYGESSSSFAASSGFQWKFCNRFGIKHLAISGEKLASNEDAATNFIADFFSVTEEFDLYEILIAIRLAYITRCCRDVH